jgi:hypothetical protein
MFSVFTYIYVMIYPMVLPLYFDEVSNLGDSPTRPWDPKEIFAPAKNAKPVLPARDDANATRLCVCFARGFLAWRHR